jgi:hypothetical protein
METIKLNTSDTQVQTITITPDPITPPTRTVPLEQYVQQLTVQQKNLQTQLDAVAAKIDALTAQNVDVVAIQTKLANKVATPINIIKEPVK